MYDDALLSRIWSNPETFGGKPTIRDTRISVELILALLAQGEKVETILDDYHPDLDAQDIKACREYVRVPKPNQSRRSGQSWRKVSASENFQPRTRSVVTVGAKSRPSRSIISLQS
jgi:uncharacterized protein (DUF433 family)